MNLAEIVIMVFRVVFLEDGLAGKGLRSIVFVLGNVDVGACGACESFRRSCIPKSEY